VNISDPVKGVDIMHMITVKIISKIAYFTHHVRVYSLNRVTHQ